MSGCHPPYIEMPVCEHLVPMKFSCLDCQRGDASPFIREIKRIKDRLDKLELHIKSLTDMYKEVSIEHVQLLEEERQSYYLHKCSIEALKLRIKELEPFQEITHLQYQNRKLNNNRIPYACPVCKGLTLLPVKLLERDPEKNKHYPPLICKACNGKGIVWNKE